MNVFIVTFDQFSSLLKNI